jgi:putative glutamine amidotransferase
MTIPRIAIPVPHSGDRDYAERALPQYERAVREAGGEPVRIELDLTSEEILRHVQRCDAVLLPGSRADVDPEKYRQDRHEKTAEADVRRNHVDEVLLHEAYRLRKPILGICYGLQSLNVYRSGTLVQDIESSIKHQAGREVSNAHTVELENESRLNHIVAQKILPVNSSHHQSAANVGTDLRVVARSPVDGVIEALEGTVPEHFVLAVQWHPERSVQDEAEVAEPSKKIFEAFIEAARGAGDRRG